MVNGLQQPTLPSLILDFASALESLAIAFPPVLADPLTELATAVTELEASLSQFQPPLGSQPSQFIRLLGEWLSTPFNMMTIWMAFMLIIFLFAKAMHGRNVKPTLHC